MNVMILKLYSKFLILNPLWHYQLNKRYYTKVQNKPKKLHKVLYKKFKVSQRHYTKYYIKVKLHNYLNSRFATLLVTSCE